MFKRILQKSNTEVHFKPGILKPSHLEPRLTNHLGVPASASILGYEPAQRLLAVGSRDGRIKIFGGPGVEVLFKSPTNAPCKYMEFVINEGRLIHVTTRNDIEVWDLHNKVLVTSKTWASDITAFAVLQGSPFLYIGDETGQVSVVLFDKENGVLSQMQYNIPAHITLSGLVEPDDANAPSVVSILPQPDAAHNRVCFVYGNGILVVWGIHEAQVVAVRGGTEAQQKRLRGEKPSSEDDEEEKEPCSACWACPLGTVVAVGYTDGDIWLWSMSGSKAPSSPDFEVNLSSEDFRMPVVLLRWSSSGKTDRGPNGLLYVFGGFEMGKPEAVTVLSVLDPTCRRDLKLRGPFADIFLIPSVTGGANGVVAVLTSPGCLEVHEEANLLSSAGEQMTLQPVSFVHPATSSPVLTAKLVVVSERSAVTGFLHKAGGVLKGYMPTTLPNGSRWPVNGGSLASTAVPRKCLYVTGYENGLVGVWDASTPSVGYIATLNNTVIAESELASVTAIDLCGSSGVLAVGDESGRVFVYKLCAESNGGACHFINRNEPSSEKTFTFQHESGIQIISVVCFHEAAIRSIMVAGSSSCIAIGDDAGLVTLFDLESFAVRFHGKCSSTSSIVSFCFMNVPANDASSSAASSKNESSIVFVLSRDATITCFDGKNGSMVGSGRPKHPSVAVSLHLLDPTGATVTSVNRTPSKKTTKQSVVMAVIETDQSGAHIEPAAGIEEGDEDIAQDNDWTGTDNMLLLCAEDSLRLYSISAALQGMRTTIRKIKLENRCCSASTFEAELHGYGVLLLYDTGDIEIRSLPELEILKICPLSACLSWEITSPSFFRTFAPACNGRIAAVEAEREVLFMSVVADENDMGLPGSHPLLYDRDIATATEAAMTVVASSFHQVSKKKQNQLQDLFGGVMKEIKHSLGSGSTGASASAGDRVGGDRVGGELLKLFSRPLIGASSIAQRVKPSPRQAQETPSPRSNTESFDSPSTTENEQQLDIDDIDLDDDDFRSPSPSSSSGKKGGVMKKLKSSFKGKKRASLKGDETEERNMLFEGGTKEGKAEQKMPTMRTAEEIRAAYGHKKAGEASSAAAQARDRLMERQERLQNINRRTEEMQENAENFQSLAEELAKKMEARKWWEI